MFVPNTVHLFDQGGRFSGWIKLHTYTLTLKGNLKAEQDPELTHDHPRTTELQDANLGRITPHPGV